MSNKKTLKSSIALTFSFLLAACGGGGGGGGNSSPTTPSTTTFPVAQAYSQLLINGFQKSFTISGKVSGTSVSGNGTFTMTSVTAATFENQSGMRNTETYSGSIIANGQSVPFTTQSQIYFDSNYNQIGEIDDNGVYTIASAPFALPITVHVNDSGTLGTATAYTSSTNRTVEETINATYNIEADSATSVIFAVTAKHYDTSHSLTETDVYRYRITDNAVATFLSLSGTTSDGDQFKYTFN